LNKILIHTIKKTAFEMLKGVKLIILFLKRKKNNLLKKMLFPTKLSSSKNIPLDKLKKNYKYFVSVAGSELRNNTMLIVFLEIRGNFIKAIKITSPSAPCLIQETQGKSSNPFISAPFMETINKNWYKKENEIWIHIPTYWFYSFQKQIEKEMYLYKKIIQKTNIYLNEDVTNEILTFLYPMNNLQGIGLGCSK